jgi:hypothetical protein
VVVNQTQDNIDLTKITSLKDLGSTISQTQDIVDLTNISNLKYLSLTIS